MPLWASKWTPRKVAQFDALNWRKRCYGAGGGGDSWSMIDVKVNLLRQQHQQHKHTFFFAEESRWSTESMKKKQQHFCTSAILCRSALHCCENTHTQQTICVCVNHMEPALAAINARWTIVWYAVIGIGGDWSCSGSACCITSCTHTAEPGEKCSRNDHSEGICRQINRQSVKSSGEEGVHNQYSQGNTRYSLYCEWVVRSWTFTFRYSPP